MGNVFVKPLDTNGATGLPMSLPVAGGSGSGGAMSAGTTDGGKVFLVETSGGAFDFLAYVRIPTGLSNGKIIDIDSTSNTYTIMGDYSAVSCSGYSSGTTLEAVVVYPEVHAALASCYSNTNTDTVAFVINNSYGDLTFTEISQYGLETSTVHSVANGNQGNFGSLAGTAFVLKDSSGNIVGLINSGNTPVSNGDTITVDITSGASGISITQQ